jgi:hypothetical protein
MSLFKTEGTGKAGRSPRPRLRATRSTQLAPQAKSERSGLPCAIGFNGCFALSLVIGFLATIPGVMRSIIAS